MTEASPDSSDLSRPGFFRPCIDLHAGRVKQIVGATLRDGQEPETNFETDRSAAWFADLYHHDGLAGGHVIMLGPGNETAAGEALAAFPGGLQVGGGITRDNALSWLDAGASHVIVTSHVFHEGCIDWPRLEALAACAGRDRLVLDLSCRARDGRYFVVTDRWQKWTDFEIVAANLERLGAMAAEFLVHAADVEGRRGGGDLALVRLLADAVPIPTTYAGGIRSLEDFEEVIRAGKGRLSATVGSALDIFGGTMSYTELVARNRHLVEKSPSFS